MDLGRIKPTQTYFNMGYEEKEIKANVVYKGKILNLRVDDILTPDGCPAKREYVEHRGGAGILAIDNEGYVYLVRQYRYAYREELLEIPAGKLEVGEAPIITATRELEEETGLKGKIADFGLLYPTPGYTNEPLYVFLATDLEKVERHLDEGEFLDVVCIPFREAYDKVMRGELRDGKTVFAILKYHALKIVVTYNFFFARTHIHALKYS